MKQSHIYNSALWMVGAILAFSLTAIAGREATHGDDALSISQLIFFRSIIGLLLVSCLVYWRLSSEDVAVRQSIFKLHLGRNAAHIIGQWCWFYGLALLPLAQVFAIEFTVPIWTAIFASILLSEQLSWRRVIAIGLGFVGVLVILRPGLIAVPLAAWIVLVGAIAYALSHTITKRLSDKVSALSILFYMHVIQLPIALVLVCFDFAWPQGVIWFYVGITAVAALTAHFCIAKALSYSDAMLVMPMDFLRLPLIAVIGFLFYGEVVDIWLLIGAGVMLFGNVMTLKEKPVS